MNGTAGRISLNQEGRTALILAVINLVFGILIAGQFFGPLKGLTGDEPHYVIVAHSIVSDGDLDLWDDYSVERAWESFYSGSELPPHYAPGISGRYSTRIIGYGLYLVPFYQIGRWAGDPVFWTRLGGVVLYAALLAFLYLLLRDMKLSNGAALVTWALASFTVPLVLYSYSLYPETAAALLSILAFRGLIRWDEKSGLPPLLAGIWLALLPWLGLKYAVLSVILGIAWLVKILRGKAPLLFSIARLCAGPLLFAALLLLYLYSFYGTFSPAAIYQGVGEGAKTAGGLNLQSAGVQDPVTGTVRMLLLYFFDQRDGLLFYSPYLLLGIVGLMLVAGRKEGTVTLIVVFCAYWLVYALSHWTSGHAPPGRPLTAVIWVLFVGLACALDKARGLIGKALLYSGGAIALCWTTVFLINNFLAYHVILKHSETHGNNFLASITLPLDVTVLFPNLVNPYDIHPWPTILFVTLAVAAVLLIARSTGGPDDSLLARPSPAVLLPAVLIPVALFSLAFSQAEMFPPESMQGSGAVRLVFTDDDTYGYEPVERQGERLPGFWVKGMAEGRVNVVLGRKPAIVRLHILSLTPQQVDVHVEGATFNLLWERSGWKQIEIPGEIAARWIHRPLFRVTLDCSSGYRPSDHGATDTRLLGCRVAVEAEFGESK